MPQPQIIDLRDRPTLKLIGGVPRAAKSLIANKLYQRDGLISFSMDALVCGFIDAAPETKIDWSATTERDSKIVGFATPIARLGLRAYGRYLLEGEAITPAVADGLREHFDIDAQFLILSAPDISAIEANEIDHRWVHRLDSTEKVRLVENLKIRSAMVSEGCDRYGFPIIDMSQGSFEQRIEDVMNRFETRTPSS